jgi:hypothetical protein
MAVARVAAGHHDAISPIFEGFENKQWIDAAGAGDPYEAHIRPVLGPGHARQIRPGVRAPVADKSDDFGLKVTHNHVDRIS